MTDLKFCKKMLSLINNMKNNKLKEKILNIGDYIKEIINKKTEEFDKSVKKFKNDESYDQSINNPLIHRHFFFRVIQEINKELIKNNEHFSIDITTALGNFFEQQTLVYWELNGYYNIEENTSNEKLVIRDLQCLKLIIKEHTNDE